MVAPYATVQEPRRKIGTAILIPVTNPIESVFATVRHRTVRTKGSLSPKTAKLMVFKLVSAAAKTWRRLKGENQLPKGRPRRQIPQRRRGHRDASSQRRLIDLVTQNPA
jgi:hypothetical protein